jgi:hypothetical protein
MPPISKTLQELFDEEGFPETHTGAFLQIAKDHDCVILTRTPGGSAGGLLRDGYDAKSFHIKAKSCNWGPMSGFLCLDPLMTKTGQEGAKDNLESNHKSLHDGYEGKYAAVTPIRISADRIQWLEMVGKKIKINARTTEYISGEAQNVPPARKDKKTGVAIGIQFLLVKRGDLWWPYYDFLKFYDVAAGEKSIADLSDDELVPKLWAKALDGVPYDEQNVNHVKLQGYLKEILELMRRYYKEQLPPKQKIDGVDCSRYLPVLAMVNPHPPYATTGPDAYKNAITGDYDLFAIWPRKEQAGEDDKRLAGMKQSTTDQQIFAGEGKSDVGKVVGNISIGFILWPSW